MKIAFTGASGVGKSTLSTGVFYNLKKDNYNVEYIPEIIKYSVFNQENFQEIGFHTRKTLEQLELEKKFINGYENGIIDYIICEAPLFTGIAYTKLYGNETEYPFVKNISLTTLNTYDKIIFVKHIDKEFNGKARNETFDDSMKVQNFLDNIISTEYTGEIIKADKFTDINTLIKEILK